MRSRDEKSSSAAWFLASVTLACIIISERNNDLSIAWPVTAAPADRPVDSTDGPEPVLIGAPDVALLDAIIERPLFSASRRSFERHIRERPGAVALPVETVSLTLTGTLLAGEERLALLMHPVRGLLRLREGQRVDGWRIDDILEHDVYLKRADETIRLELQKVTATERRSPTNVDEIDDALFRLGGSANTDDGEVAKRFRR